MELTIRSRTHSQVALLALGGIAGVIFFISFSFLGVISPEYRAARDAISSLEFVRFGFLQRLNFMLFGSLQLCFAVALYRELKGGRGTLGIPLFQIICATAVIGSGVWTHDPLHLACDLVAFNSTMVVLFLFAWRFWADPRWRGWSSYSIATGIAMMTSLAAFGFAQRNGGYAGLYERLAVAIRSAWSLLFVMKIFLGTDL